MQIRLFCAVAASLATSVSTAQDGRHSGPADPSAAVPTLRYESAFAGYRRHADEKPLSWREANEEVHRLGGHVGHVPLGAARKGTPPQPTPRDGQGARP